MNMNGNDDLDWGWWDVQCLPCSSLKLLFGTGNPLFPSLAVLILPCRSTTVSLQCLVGFDAGGCEDLGPGVFILIAPL